MEIVSIETELRALLRVIFDLRVPEEGQTHLQIKRPESLTISDLSRLDNLVEAIIREVTLSFDLRRKSEDDDPDEIERWKTRIVEGEWVERRKNHRLRIRTSVDDLFDKHLGLSAMPAAVRAWRLQVVDECADAVLSRFHVRPASSGPWASYRQTLYDIGQDLQQALGCRNLFLMTGRTGEVKMMLDAIERAQQATRALLSDIEERET